MQSKNWTSLNFNVKKYTYYISYITVNMTECGGKDCQIEKATVKH